MRGKEDSYIFLGLCTHIHTRGRGRPLHVPLCAGRTACEASGQACSISHAHMGLVYQFKGRGFSSHSLQNSLGNGLDFALRNQNYPSSWSTYLLSLLCHPGRARRTEMFTHLKKVALQLWKKHIIWNKNRRNHSFLGSYDINDISDVYHYDWNEREGLYVSWSIS